MELDVKGKAPRRAAPRPALRQARKERPFNIEDFYGGMIKTSGFPTDMIRGVYRIDPAMRIRIIKRGVSPYVFTSLARWMDRSKEDLGKTLGLSVTTIDRKAKLGEKLSAEQGERVVGMAKLIGQVQAMVDESGEPDGFDAAQWVAGWLDTPVPALGGDRPAEYMDTAEGRELVSRLLAMMQSGAYA